MAYAYRNSKGKTYYLHCKTTISTSGKSRSIYFFAKEVGAGALSSVPAGYIVSETKNGLPVLKRTP
jgi:hypothetical protein